MKRVHATILSRPPLWQYLSLVVACAFIVLALMQLFAYEQMPAVMRLLAPGVEDRLQPILLALLVSASVFAVPYFIPIALSPLARICSLLAAIFAPTMWLWLSLSAFIAGYEVNAGLFGAKFDVRVGVFSVLTALGLLAAVLLIAYTDARRSK